MLGSNINLSEGQFIIGGVEDSGYLNKTVTHHELLHLAQFIDNPAISTKGIRGLGNEIIPAFIGTPEIYGGGTVIIGGTVYGGYELSK